eukprot:Rhum_TRINITY_DN14556_c0_g1::Rhum_TRINITY_DN14556_c0_g1_i2::g.97099::m.97099
MPSGGQGAVDAGNGEHGVLVQVHCLSRLRAAGRLLRLLGLRAAGLLSLGVLGLRLLRRGRRRLRRGEDRLGEGLEARGLQPDAELGEGDVRVQGRGLEGLTVLLERVPRVRALLHDLLELLLLDVRLAAEQTVRLVELHQHQLVRLRQHERQLLTQLAALHGAVALGTQLRQLLLVLLAVDVLALTVHPVHGVVARLAERHAHLLRHVLEQHATLLRLRAELVRVRLHRVLRVLRLLQHAVRVHHLRLSLGELLNLERREAVDEQGLDVDVQTPRLLLLDDLGLLLLLLLVILLVVLLVVLLHLDLLLLLVLLVHEGSLDGDETAAVQPEAHGNAHGLVLLNLTLQVAEGRQTAEAPVAEEKAAVGRQHLVTRLLVVRVEVERLLAVEREVEHLRERAVLHVQRRLLVDRRDERHRRRRRGQGRVVADHDRVRQRVLHLELDAHARRQDGADETAALRHGLRHVHRRHHLLAVRLLQDLPDLRHVRAAAHQLDELHLVRLRLLLRQRHKRAHALPQLVADLVEVVTLVVREGHVDIVHDALDVQADHRVRRQRVPQLLASSEEPQLGLLLLVHVHLVLALDLRPEVVREGHVEVTAAEVLVVHVRQHLHVALPELARRHVRGGVTEVDELHDLALLLLLGQLLEDTPRKGDGGSLRHERQALQGGHLGSLEQELPLERAVVRRARQHEVHKVERLRVRVQVRLAVRVLVQLLEEDRDHLLRAEHLRLAVELHLRADVALLVLRRPEEAELLLLLPLLGARLHAHKTLHVVHRVLEVAHLHVRSLLSRHTSLGHIAEGHVRGRLTLADLVQDDIDTTTARETHARVQVTQVDAEHRHLGGCAFCVPMKYRYCSFY